jgi:hypothetical protein
MTLPTQTIQELISTSYVRAVIAYAGFSPSRPENDFGVDLEVRRIQKFQSKIIDSSVVLEFQLKASINWEIKDSHVIYDLEADAYNKLVYRRDRTSMPCILVLCCLPKEQSSWLKISEDEFIIRKCCYYHLIDGEETKNTGSQRIKIPRTQLLTPLSIKDLSERSLRGELS